MFTVVVIVALCVMEEGGCKAVFIAGTGTDTVEHICKVVCIGLGLGYNVLIQLSHNSHHMTENKSQSSEVRRGACS